MKIFENYFFIDPITGEQIKVTDVHINFHICRIAKAEVKLVKLEVGRSYTIRAEVADAVIKPYIVDSLSKLITIDKNYFYFALSIDTKMNLPKYTGPTDWLFNRQDHKITATAPHPWFVSISLQFYLINLENQTLTMTYEMGRRPLLMSGMNLNLIFSIPNSKHFTISCKITGYYQDKNSQLVTFKINESNNNFFKALSLSVLESGPTKSFNRLKKAGLKIPTFKDRAICLTASTKKDFGEVLNLRLESYRNKKNSKISPDTKASDVGDRFDNYSNIYIVKLGSETIATGRSVYNFGNYQQSEIFQLGYEVPEFIKKGKYIEVSRFSTHHNFRGKDLFFILLSFAFRSGFITGHRYILADCEDHLLPVYKKWGAIALPGKITHEWENVKLNVVYFDLHKIVKKAKLISLIPYLSKRYKSLADEILKLSDSPFKD